MERDEFLRAAWRAMVAEAIDPQRLVFVDEIGANIGLCPLYGWSRGGERVHMRAPRNRGPNTTLLSSMSAQGMGPCLAVEGSTNAVVFETYIEKVLTPTLEPGQIVVMDNLCAHKGRRVKELIERRGCEFCCTCHPTPRRTSTPSRKPSPRSRASSEKTESRTREALVEAMGVAISAISPQDVRGFFNHCGYNTQVQSL